MDKKTTAPKVGKTVETLKHDEAKRKNIPTAEHQSVLKQDDASPHKVKYPRTTDLDPQLGEDLFDLPGFALAHQTVVDENDLELGAQRPVGQDRAGGAVDAPGQGGDSFPAPHGLLDVLDLLGNEFCSVHNDLPRFSGSIIELLEAVEEGRAPAQNPSG